MSEQIELKECTRCGELKPVTEFNRYYDSYQPYCRICQMEYNRERTKKLNITDEIAQAWELNSCAIKKQNGHLKYFINDLEVTQANLDDLNRLIKYVEGK